MTGRACLVKLRQDHALSNYDKTMAPAPRTDGTGLRPHYERGRIRSYERSTNRDRGFARALRTTSWFVVRPSGGSLACRPGRACLVKPRQDHALSNHDKTMPCQTATRPWRPHYEPGRAGAVAASLRVRSSDASRLRWGGLAPALRTRTDTLLRAHYEPGRACARTWNPAARLSSVSPP